MTLQPAAPGTGIVFRRRDLGGVELAAQYRTVVESALCTTLANDAGVKVATIEHLMAAFAGLEIDNAIVELDNLEVPILDGSALPFVEMLNAAGIRQQRRKRVYLKILRPYELREGDKFIGVYPAERYSVSYAIDFPHPLIGSERFQVELSNGSYVHDIAAARTFGFLEQQRAMLNMGLIRGASRDNCVVLTRDGIDNPPLRFDNEFVRHKVLDLIGDLALFGKRILGYVKADRAGHALHTAIVSRILRDQTYAEEITLSEAVVANWPAENVAVAD